MLEFNNPSFEELVSKEWLVTNGIGGYASGTLSGANSRRYHGLLVASLNPPTQRQVLVSKIEEVIVPMGEKPIELSTNCYPGAVHPKGYKSINKFLRGPFPRIHFQVEENQLAKTVFMVHGSNTTVVEYENTGNQFLQLSVRPLFVDRDYHSLFHEDPYFDYYVEKQQGICKIYSHYGTYPVFMKYDKGEFREERFWVNHFEYPKEQYRGLDFQEDAIAIGNIRFGLEPGEKAFLMFTLDEAMLSQDPQALKDAEEERLEALDSTSQQSPFVKDLLIAGDQFIVHRQSTGSFSIIAGYHWFTDWGRDTMIAMRGLCIAPGKKEVSQSILETFLTSLSEGMLPNRFPDFADEAVEYNTVDATLWLFVALYEYYLKFEDKAFIQAHFDKLREIIEWHVNGTRYKIHLTEEGFIYAGEGNNQLTWMDARVGDFVVTPRHGCPVEIQALWYNALKIYQFLAGEIDLSAERDISATCNRLCNRLENHFSNFFLNDDGYLNDVVVPGSVADQSLRPNQLYVLSLPFSLLNKSEEKQVFGWVRDHLYTPYGLRTLKEDHPDFKSYYGGDQWQRDTAYHQGTVWPFLLADYFVALKKIEGENPETQSKIESSLQTLQHHFYELDCIHGLSEIFDGKDPGPGRGTAHQAWSVGALLLTLLN